MSFWVPPSERPAPPAMSNEESRRLIEELQQSRDRMADAIAKLYDINKRSEKNSANPINMDGRKFFLDQIDKKQKLINTQIIGLHASGVDIPGYIPAYKRVAHKFPAMASAGNKAARTFNIQDILAKTAEHVNINAASKTAAASAATAAASAAVGSAARDAHSAARAALRAARAATASANKAQIMKNGASKFIDALRRNSMNNSIECTSPSAGRGSMCGWISRFFGEIPAIRVLGEMMSVRGGTRTQKRRRRRTQTRRA